jgi:D-alanyl-D-alanine carboxypeptidase
MLLDHTSGLFNVGDEGDVIADIAKLTDPALRSEATDLASRYSAGENVLIPDRLFVALADTHPRYFEPGTGYHYGNVNYQLAAMVLTRATGRSVAELLRSRITDPLGLHRTTLAPDDTSSPDMHGYVAEATGPVFSDVTDDMLAIGNGGGGGVISTADELLTIMQAIVSGRLLDATLEADMKRATVESSGSYGLGLATYHLTCGTFYGHGGAIDGTQSIAIVRPDASAGVVVAVNLRKATDPELVKFADTLICAT